MKKMIITFLKSSTFKGLFELTIAIVVMCAVSFLFVIISTQRQPEFFQAKNKQGVYELRVYDAQKPENLTLSPQKIEKKRTDFEYSFGRKLLKERQNRSLVQWPADSMLKWQLEKPPAGKYTLSFKYKQNAQNTEFNINFLGQNHKISAKPSTKWRTLKMAMELAEQEKDCWLTLSHSQGRVDFNSLKLELPKQSKKKKTNKKGKKK